MSLSYSPRVNKVLEDAQRHAKGRGREFVGTEDILMCLYYESGGIAHEALMEIGVNGAALLAAVDRLAPPEPKIVNCQNCCGTGKVKA